MNLQSPDLESRMLNQFDCAPLAAGSRREDRQRIKRRERAEQTLRHFRTVSAYAGTKDDALERVKEQFLCGMGPLTAIILWAAIGALVQKIVFWLWDEVTNADAS